MTTRQFDPVLSAALRNELEALADAIEPDASTMARPLLHRPQVWVTAVTAVILLVATIGVLHLTARPAALPAHRDTLSDPLAQITDRSSADYIGDAPLVLLQTSGTGASTATIDVPSGVTSVRPYLRCAPEASFRVSVGKGYSTGCDARSADFGDIPVTAGRQDVAVRIPAGVQWRLLVIATPDGSTTTLSTLQVTTGPAVVGDPLDEITNPASTLFVADTVRPILHERATGSRSFPLHVPAGVQDVTFYLSGTAGSTWTLVTDSAASGTCSGRLEGSVGVPAAQLRSSVRVDVPAGTAYWLLAIPTEP